jgi:hypothetical protein
VGFNRSISQQSNSAASAALAASLCAAELRNNRTLASLNIYCCASTNSPRCKEPPQPSECAQHSSTQASLHGIMLA